MCLPGLSFFSLNGWVSFPTFFSTTTPMLFPVICPLYYIVCIENRVSLMRQERSPLIQVPPFSLRRLRSHNPSPLWPKNCNVESKPSFRDPLSAVLNLRSIHTRSVLLLHGSVIFLGNLLFSLFLRLSVVKATFSQPVAWLCHALHGIWCPYISVSPYLTRKFGRNRLASSQQGRLRPPH